MKIFSNTKSGYPRRWLSYKTRLRQDVEDAFDAEEGKEVLDESYVAALTETIKTLDGWILRTFSMQVAIFLFLFASLFRDPTKPLAATIFGIPVEAREILLALSTILAIVSWTLASSRDIRVWIVEKIVELNTPKDFVELKKIAAPAAFNLQMYLTKPYARWVFPRPAAKFLFGATAALMISTLGAILAFSLWLLIYVWIDVYQNPSLPGYATYVILWFVVIGNVFGVLWTVRLHMPLPYEDRGPVKPVQPAATLKRVR